MADEFKLESMVMPVPAELIAECDDRAKALDKGLKLLEENWKNIGKEAARVMLESAKAVEDVCAQYTSEDVLADFKVVALDGSVHNIDDLSKPLWFIPRTMIYEVTGKRQIPERKKLEILQACDSAIDRNDKDNTAVLQASERISLEMRVYEKAAMLLTTAVHLNDYVPFGNVYVIQPHGDTVYGFAYMNRYSVLVPENDKLQPEHRVIPGATPDMFCEPSVTNRTLEGFPEDIKRTANVYLVQNPVTRLGLMDVHNCGLDMIVDDINGKHAKWLKNPRDGLTIGRRIGDCLQSLAMRATALGRAIGY